MFFCIFPFGYCRPWGDGPILESGSLVEKLWRGDKSILKTLMQVQLKTHEAGRGRRIPEGFPVKNLHVSTFHLSISIFLWGKTEQLITPLVIGYSMSWPTLLSVLQKNPKQYNLVEDVWNYSSFQETMWFEFPVMALQSIPSNHYIPSYNLWQKWESACCNRASAQVLESLSVPQKEVRAEVQLRSGEFRLMQNGKFIFVSDPRLCWIVGNGENGRPENGGLNI